MPANRRPPTKERYPHSSPITREILLRSEGLKQASLNIAVQSNSYMSQLRYGVVKDPCISKLEKLADALGYKIVLVPK